MTPLHPAVMTRGLNVSIRHQVNTRREDVQASSPSRKVDARRSPEEEVQRCGARPERWGGTLGGKALGGEWSGLRWTRGMTECLAAAAPTMDIWGWPWMPRGLSNFTPPTTLPPAWMASVSRPSLQLWIRTNL